MNKKVILVVLVLLFLYLATGVFSQGNVRDLCSLYGLPEYCEEDFNETSFEDEYGLPFEEADPCLAFPGQTPAQGCELDCDECYCAVWGGADVKEDKIDNLRLCHFYNATNTSSWVGMPEVNYTNADCVADLNETPFAGCNISCTRCYCTSTEGIGISNRNIDDEKTCLFNPKDNSTEFGALGLDDCDLGVVDHVCRCNLQFCGHSEYYYGNCCDLDGDDIGDTCQASACVGRASGLIDLSVEAIIIDPPYPRVSDKVNISVVIRNNGIGPSYVAWLKLRLNSTKYPEISEGIANVDPGESLIINPESQFTIREEGDFLLTAETLLGSYLREDYSLNNNQKTIVFSVSRTIRCGDGHCDEGESQQNCCRDCRCDFGYRCEDNACVEIPPDLCQTNNDCEDGNPCTLDICGGFPKECSRSLETYCVVNDGCCPKGCNYRNDNDCEKPTFCGNNICEAPFENIQTCCADCGCPENYECSADLCIATSEVGLGVGPPVLEVEVPPVIEQPSAIGDLVVSLVRSRTFQFIIIGIFVIGLGTALAIFIVRRPKPVDHVFSEQDRKMREYIQSLRGRGYNDEQITNYLEYYKYSPDQIKKFMK